MNFNKIIKAGFFITGSLATGIGFYLWYKSGVLIPLVTFEERYTNPNAGVPILLIIIGAAIFIYGLFIQGEDNSKDDS